jgi:hypothetical protein
MFKLHIRLAGDSKAFCEGGVMDYKLYCLIPKPFNTMPEYAPHGPKDSLWLLVSAIYGVKQAARQYSSEVISYCTGPMKMIQSQRDPCVLIRWFDQQEVTKYKKRQTPALCTHAHIDSPSAVAEARQATSDNRGRGSSSGRSNGGNGKRSKGSKHGTGAVLANLVAFLLCGAWVDDKVVVTVDEGLYENWFLPVLNERFITNDEGMPALLLGFDTLYDRVRGILKISHMSAITKFATKHSLLEISSSTSPCTQEMQKQIKNSNYNNSPEEATETEAIGGAYRMYLGSMGHWVQTTMPQLKATTGLERQNTCHDRQSYISN